MASQIVQYYITPFTKLINRVPIFTLFKYLFNFFWRILRNFSCDLILFDVYFGLLYTATSKWPSIYREYLFRLRRDKPRRDTYITRAFFWTAKSYFKKQKIPTFHEKSKIPRRETLTSRRMIMITLLNYNTICRTVDNYISPGAMETQVCSSASTSITKMTHP